MPKHKRPPSTYQPIGVSGGTHARVFWTASQKPPKKPRQPKMPKPAKIARPKSKDLRMIYKGLMTVSVQNRIASLAYALQWYDGAIPYVIQKVAFTPDVQKKIELAVKCRKQAIGTTHDHEKETAFLTAIRCYEKACVGLKPPAVDQALAEFESKKTVLAEKQAKLEQRYGFIVKLLQSAIGDRVKLEVADAVKAVQYNPSLTTLSYNREAVKGLAEQYKVEGLMPVFFDQLEVLSRHAALTSDGMGGLQYSADEQLKVIDHMLKEFVKFSKSQDAPRRLVKSGQVIPQAARVTLGPVAPRPPRQSAKGPKVAGRYQSGCNLAEHYLYMEDGQLHEEAEALARLNAENPRGILNSLEKDGYRFGEWTIEHVGTQIRMVKAAQGVQP